MADTIDVFSDLVLHIAFDERDAVAAQLKAAARGPWSFDSERSEEMRRNAVGDRRVLAFTRVPTGDLPAACLLYTSPSPRDRTRSRMPSSA